MFCSVTSHAAPAGTNLEQMIGGLEAKTAAERVIFRGLRLLQRQLGRDEEAAGVSHRGVEPEPVEIVSEVVVLGDIAAADLHRVGPEQVLHAVCTAEKIQRERAALGARHAGGVLDVFDEPREHGGQIIRVPLTVHEGLDEADVAEEHAAFEEAGAQDAQACGGFGRVAETARGAVGQRGFEAAKGHLRERFLDGALIEAGARGGLGRRAMMLGARVKGGAHSDGGSLNLKTRRRKALNGVQ